MTKLGSSIQRLFADKKILILGMGKEGYSTLKFLRKILPHQTIAIMDIASQTPLIQDEDKNVTQILGKEFYLKKLSEFDVIFKTPSIPLNVEELQEFVEQGGTITSQLNEFLRVHSSQTIGVTGTKGKSTTTALIRLALHTAGKNVLMAGNIGIPPFEIDEMMSDDSLVAMEMSSYQLESVTFSPHWAIWLNVFNEHLNFHGNIDKYVVAKGNITLYQSADDIFIFNGKTREIEAFSLKSSAQKIAFAPFKSQSELDEIFKKKVETKLPEIFLLNDLPAVLQLMKVFSIELSVLKTALETFEPLPHRLERIDSKRGVVFVDDTLATIPEATVAAIQAFPKIQVIILGGYDRGIEYELVVDEVIKKKIPNVIFFKPSGEKMNDILNTKYIDAEKPNIFWADEMKDAVQIAFDHAESGDVVLLSPASPSFGQFKDYQDKAAQFRYWITELDE